MWRFAPLGLVVLIVLPQPLSPATIIVDAETGFEPGLCSLAEAIENANDNAATNPDCEAGDVGLDTIRLTTDVTILIRHEPQPFGDPTGPSGLPKVTSEILIEGNNFAITRHELASEFRILAVAFTGDLALTNTTVSNGRSEVGYRYYYGYYADEGAGIYNNGTLTLRNTAISGNEGGGGIFNRGVATLVNSTVSDNSGIDDGTGIHNDGVIVLSGTTVSGNRSYGGGPPGHSAFANEDHGGFLGTATLSYSSVSENSGDGISNSGSDGTVTLRNSTVSGNLREGIVELSSGLGSTYLINSTVAANSSYQISRFRGSVALTNSLIFDGDDGEFNCDRGSGTLIDNGGNLSDDDDCETIPSTLTDLDPILADNGGPTKTHALLAGSSAIDNAGSCGLAADQRGAPRFDGNCDSGAFEFGGCPLLDLNHETVVTSVAYEECEIWVDSVITEFGTPTVVVAAGGDLTLTAGTSVTLFAGFEVQTDGKLTIGIDPDLQITSALEAAAAAGWTPPEE